MCVPYNTYIYPTGGEIGTKIQTKIGGENLQETDWEVDLTNEQPGLKLIRTTYGIFPFVANEFPEDTERLVKNAANDDATETDEKDGEQAKSAESEILFQAKCSACHELRSPDNRALTAEQWESTITRMAGKENADITPTQRDRIIAFVAEEVVRMGQLIAKQIENAPTTYNTRGYQWTNI